MKIKGEPKNLISRCPFCSGELVIAKMQCRHCDTTIDSTLSVPAFFRLPEELQQFVMVFLRCRGSIRDVEKELGISYPTVCKRLDLVNELLGNKNAEDRPTRHQILMRLERGEITPKEAAELLKGGK